jgi:lactosylceramide 4-alpha-galactosyltransferase
MIRTRKFFLALLNPDLDVFVLFAYKTVYFNDSTMPVIDAILSYPNVYLFYFDIFEYSKDTPLEKWFAEGKILKSKYIIHHKSDILRILTLWKYSGTYFDLDVVVKKPVSERGVNFACNQGDATIGSAILNLNGSLGRSIAQKNFKEVTEHFNGNSWTGNGPVVLWNIAKNMCDTTEIAQMNRHHCNGFEVLPSEDCYAIMFSSWKKFFDENSIDEVLTKTNSSFAVHFWNYVSGSTKLTTNSSAPYITIAKNFCPRVFRNSGQDFN